MSAQIVHPPQKGPRLAGVIVIDLVKHSTRSKTDVQRIQLTVEQTLSHALETLGLADNVEWKHTGDGYICTLMGDAAVRMVDFLNASIPSLISQLNNYAQQVRVGLDFGLVDLHPNALTCKAEHFDLPGIRASSREQAFHALTDGHSKYIWRPLDGTEQLFDLDQDIREEHDLAKDPAHRALLERCRARLVRLLVNRPEGFTDGSKLNAGRPYPPLQARRTKI